jgi:hypothetical protein
MKVLLVILNGPDGLKGDALAVFVVFGAAIVRRRDVIAFVAFPDADESALGAKVLFHEVVSSGLSCRMRSSIIAGERTPGCSKTSSDFLKAITVGIERT